MNDFYQVNLKSIWFYLKNEKLLFWLINIYFFFEYVRPQTIYPIIDIFPFAQTALILSSLLLFKKFYFSFAKHLLGRLILLYFVVLVISSIFAFDKNIAFSNLPNFIAWMVVYFILSNGVNTEKQIFIIILAFLLYNFKMSQHSFRGWASMGFRFSSWGTGGGPGWFHNSGEFGIQMCIFLPLAAYFFIALRLYWPFWKKAIFFLFPFTALTGIISSASRGAVLGAGAVLFWMFLKSRNKVKGIIIVVLVTWIIINLIPTEQKVRFQDAGGDRTSISRLERWEKGLKMVESYPFFGVGYSNWAVADRVMFGGHGGLSHNIFIECMSELGYAGLSIFILLIIYTFYTNYQSRRLDISKGFVFYMAHGLDGALVGFLVSGFFVTVLYYPYFWINLSFTAALNNVAMKMVHDKKVFSLESNQGDGHAEFR
jgi:O-antigen ligase